MVSIEYFEPSRDFELLNEWLIAHCHPPVVQDELPKIGFIASYNSIPSAIGFLRLCEGNFAMCDSFVMSPDVKLPKVKGQLFDAVTEKLIETAKALRISHLLAYSVKSGIIKRSISKHKFIKTDHTLLIKKL